ncbi:MAG: hypothetical protein H6760_03680 [Candidatus Nomurabacteria bacterium]|nr:MAG: hypothetical protein H6760_03680 [Candidatus Nomurabacteria bacterium]
MELLNDWPYGSLLAAVILLIVLIVLVALGWGIFTAIDSWFRPLQEGRGRVVNKTFTAAHVTVMYVYNAATKTTLPQSVHHSDKWELTVDVAEGRDTVSVERQLFDAVAEGSEVTVSYVRGRLKGWVYVKSVERLT